MSQNKQNNNTPAEAAKEEIKETVSKDVDSALEGSELAGKAEEVKEELTGQANAALQDAAEKNAEATDAEAKEKADAEAKAKKEAKKKAKSNFITTKDIKPVVKENKESKPDQMIRTSDLPKTPAKDGKIKENTMVVTGKTGPRVIEPKQEKK